MEPHRLNHGVGLFIQELDDELVGVDGLDPEASRTDAGKSPRLNVTMSPAPPWIAAANT